MSEWTLSTSRPGYREKTIQRGQSTIRILRPILDAAETAKRETQARTAMESAMRTYIHKSEVRT